MPCIKTYSITNGKSTHTFSYESLLACGCSDIVVVKNKMWKEALSFCVESCNCSHFLRVDDDFILHPKAFTYMKTCIKKEQNTAVYFWQLWEDYSKNIVHAIKVYSIDALRKIDGFKFNSLGKTDRETHRVLMEAGYEIKEDKSILAIHACGNKQEQQQYNELWKSQSKKYVKARYELSLLYTKSIEYQYELRTDFLENLNRKYKTPFGKWLDENSISTT